MGSTRPPPTRQEVLTMETSERVIVAAQYGLFRLKGLLFPKTVYGRALADVVVGLCAALAEEPEQPTRRVPTLEDEFRASPHTVPPIWRREPEEPTPEPEPPDLLDLPDSAVAQMVKRFVQEFPGADPFDVACALHIDMDQAERAMEALVETGELSREPAPDEGVSEVDGPLVRLGPILGDGKIRAKTIRHLRWLVENAEVRRAVARATDGGTITWFSALANMLEDAPDNTNSSFLQG